MRSRVVPGVARRTMPQVSSQAVMMATNQLMTLCAIGFAIAAFTIWLAPRPPAGLDVSAVH